MFNEYLNVVKTCIKNKRLHGEICDELEAHLQAEKDFYMEIGYDETQAELKAVEAMGDPEKIGENMAKLHELSAGAKMIIALFCIFAAAFIVSTQIYMVLIFFFELFFFSYELLFLALLVVCGTGLFLADRYNRRLPAVMSLITVIFSVPYVFLFSVGCGAFISFPAEKAVMFKTENEVLAAFLSPLEMFLLGYGTKDWSWEDDFFGIIKEARNEMIVPNAFMWVITTVIFIALTVLLVWISVRVISEIKHYNSIHGVRAKTMKILLIVFGICVILSTVMYTKGCEYERNMQEKNQNCAEIIFDAVQQDDFMNWSFEDFKDFFSDYECNYDESELEILYTASGYGAEYTYHRSLYTNHDTGESYCEANLDFETAVPAYFSFKEFFSEDEEQKTFDDYIHHSSLIGKDCDEFLEKLKKFSYDSICAFKRKDGKQTDIWLRGYEIVITDGKITHVDTDNY